METLIIDTELYQKMFKMLKQHEYDEFIKTINLVDPMDLSFDINIRDGQNNYFLTYAVNLNKYDVVKLLIDRGARIDIVDKNNRSILIIPITYSYYEILELLLKVNNESIGMSIIDIKDKDSKISLHNAIELNNYHAIELLLKYGSNVNTIDKDGNNALHMAIKTRSVNTCELILSYVTDINSRTGNGETALHIACSLQLIEIVRLLIQHNININLQDYYHEITALHYCVLLNNTELVALLLRHNANPNIQDVDGNTPLNYVIYGNNFETFIMLTQSITTKNILNYNLWNIDGEIPLHIALKNNPSNLTDFLDIMLDKSNLSIADSDGNTCLHYLIKDGLWKEYSSVLIRKKLNILARNKAFMMPIDLLDPSDFDKFIGIVVDSYFYRLKNAKELWYMEWENSCSKNFKDLKEEEITKLGKNVTSNNFEKTCKKIINDKIVNMINLVRSGKEPPCYENTYPVKRAKKCIEMEEGSPIDYCTYTGSTLDILIGLIYLLKKYKDVCSTITKKYSENKNLCSFYKSIGILTNNRCEFLNFEMVWIHQRLYLADEFHDQFRKCIGKNKRFVIIPLGIEMREGSHANYLIYDHSIGEIERFEPHGSTIPPGLNYNPTLLDGILETRFKNIIDENVKYIRPSDYLPKIGFQLMDVQEGKKRKIGDPEGFCALWAMWYTDMRLLYRDINRKDLVKMLFKKMHSANFSFKNMIRNYGQNITKIRDKILANSKMDINDWMNDQYTDEQVNSIMKQLDIELEPIIA